MYSRGCILYENVHFENVKPYINARTLGASVCVWFVYVWRVYARAQRGYV